MRTQTDTLLTDIGFTGQRREGHRQPDVLWSLGVTPQRVLPVKWRGVTPAIASYLGKGLLYLTILPEGVARWVYFKLAWRYRGGECKNT